MRVRSIVLLGAGSLLLMGAACPTSDPFPGPPIRAPVVTMLEMSGIYSSGAYQAALHLQWDLPRIDSFTVREFVVLGKKSSDSAFTVVRYGIPDTVTECYDILAPEDFPSQGDYAKRWYRIFAIDSSGRPGDTSAPDSIRICWPPRPSSSGDTLRQNSFKWYTIQYMAGYFTYLFLWSHSRGLIWTSPRPSEPSYGHETLDSFYVSLPSSLYPLERGAYSYGLKVEMPGENIQSLAVQEFYAP